MLSVVMIVKNEEKDLPEALESVSFADEIIVVDDNSTDRTAVIATAAGAKIVTRTLDDYSAQRNFGASQAKNDWILALDGDERVNAELQKSILSATSSPQFDAYSLRRIDVMFGRQMRYGEVGKVWITRLYRRSKLGYVRPVHEFIEAKDAGKLTGSLTHHSHQNLSELFDKINRYSTLDAKSYFDQGVKESAHRLISYPLAKFIVNYFWKLGFLDGFPGLVLAVAMSTHSFLVRGKLRLLWTSKK